MLGQKKRGGEGGQSNHLNSIGHYTQHTLALELVQNQSAVPSSFLTS